MQHCPWTCPFNDNQLEMHGCICSYWYSGAKAPSNQYSQYWLNIHYVGAVPCRDIIIMEGCIKMNFYFGKKYPSCLTHWGRATHMCVGKLTTIGSENGLSPGRRQAIIWTNAGILIIGPLGTNFSEILIGIQTFSFRKMHLKISSAKWRPFCLGLNELRVANHQMKTVWHGFWIVITHAPLFRGGADHVYELPLGDSCFGNEYS